MVCVCIIVNVTNIWLASGCLANVDGSPPGPAKL